MDVSIIPLLEHWEEFQRENECVDLKDFAHWILGDGKNERKPVGLQKTESSNNERTAILINRLQKYLTLAVKPAIRELGFTKDNEYHFLYQIWKVGVTNKNDLSKESAVEFSTGRDIIKRLIFKKFVFEKQNPADKRASLLSLTAKGKKIIEKSFEKLILPFNDYLGDLNEKEQIQLITLLTKLNKYHEKKTREMAPQ